MGLGIGVGLGFGFGGGAGKAAPFDPATLSLTGWFRDYAGLTWSGVASAGTSASQFLDGGTAPSVGTPLNGHGVASLNGSSQFTDQNTSSSTGDYFTATNLSGWALVNVTSIATNNTGAHFQNDALVASQGTGQDTLYFRSGGGSPVFGLSLFVNPGSEVFVEAAFTTSAWHLVQWKADGSTIKVRVDGGAWQSASGGTINSITTIFQVGKSPGGQFMTGSIAELATSKAVLSDADFDNVRSYITAHYGVTV